MVGASMPPDTHYAKSGEINIAYQVVGEGPSTSSSFQVHLVSGPAMGGSEMAGFFEKLASFSRLILFDKRGTGLSDRSPARPRSRTAWTTCAP